RVLTQVILSLSFSRWPRVIFNLQIIHGADADQYSPQWCCGVHPLIVELFTCPRDANDHFRRTEILYCLRESCSRFFSPYLYYNKGCLDSLNNATKNFFSLLDVSREREDQLYKFSGLQNVTSACACMSRLS